METKPEDEVKQFTWAEIKRLIETAGVMDDDEVDGIDIAAGKLKDFECIKDEIFGWKIRL